MHCTREGIPHQRGEGRRQGLLAQCRGIAQRLQVHPAQACELLDVQVAVDGGEAALGAGKRRDGGQLLEGGCLDGHGHGLSCGEPLRSTSDRVTPLPATPCSSNAGIGGKIKDMYHRGDLLLHLLLHLAHTDGG